MNNKLRTIKDKILILIIFVVIVFLASFGFPKKTLTAYYTSGYRISPPLSLGEITNVAESKIEWDAETEEGVTDVIIETAVTDSDSEIPTSWTEAANGGPIPGIEKGDNLAGKYLWTKQTLITNNSEKTPKLKSLTETIKPEVRVEGYRISPELDFSGEGKVKDSRIFWETDEKSEGRIKVEVKVFANGNWSDWQEVANGSSIPGLEPETSLFNVRIQTKTSFVGGPDFFPSLENIKIFIETE